MTLLSLLLAAQAGTQSLPQTPRGNATNSCQPVYAFSVMAAVRELRRGLSHSKPDNAPIPRWNGWGFSFEFHEGFFFEISVLPHLEEIHTSFVIRHLTYVWP